MTARSTCCNKCFKPSRSWTNTFTFNRLRGTPHLSSCFPSDAPTNVRRVSSNAAIAFPAVSNSFNSKSSPSPKRQDSTLLPKAITDLLYSLILFKYSRGWGQLKTLPSLLQLETYKRKVWFNLGPTPTWSAISHSFTSVLRLSSLFEIDLSNIPRSCGSVCNPFARFTVFNNLCLFTEFTSMTCDNVDLQIFRRMKNQSSCSKAGGRSARSLLCVQGLSFYPLDYILVKRKWFSLQGTWLTEWLILCLWWKAPLLDPHSDVKIVTFTLRDPCTRSLRTF